MAKQYDVLIRLLMLGDSGVGKTSMLCKFTEEGFNSTHIPTIGIDFKMKTLMVDDKKIRIQIWDTAGQERYDTITKQYFRRAQGIMLVYDITSEISFRHISKWLDMIDEGAGSVARILVANKSDASALRIISKEEGQTFAREKNLAFVEGSAFSGDNLDEAFEGLVKIVMDRNKKDIDEQLQSIKLYGSRENSTIDAEVKPGGCCS
ncbi:ras-related protein Rab-15 [Strongylocentrotus purpuratus]|uniref:Ras-related protein Rab-15 n=1 Tax=Strongylocentrotus purpuratus TaxID=7668 RepID=A0A7M7RBW7_STRPU|nr:ras-related protein Rab-15 [Strongylocentrotus purpuratus]|eukprot:XP_787126.1 PREDICTED: ras-related protein Rab-15 [Strongylocentrotus purpuratus]